VESGKAYLDTLRDHVLTHGCPLAFYSDRHGIFRVNAKDAQSGDGKTEFGRVVERLEIGLINALTPQAKGRVERANGNAIELWPRSAGQFWPTPVPQTTVALMDQGAFCGLESQSGFV
jgi:hypothetical protein